MLWVLQARELTKDHRLTAQDERDGVVQRGGAVVTSSFGQLRLVWTRVNPKTKSLERLPFLNMARSLGDYWSQNAVSCMPDVTTHTIDHDDVLILASDGVWDVMTPEDAARMVIQVPLLIILNILATACKCRAVTRTCA